MAEALERVGLAAVDERPVRAYSLGMRQRLALAGALLRSPRLLVLDEPTNGLDPQGIQEIRELLLDLNRAGTTVFLSSHLLGEIEQICTRVGVLDRGRLVLQAELDELRRPTGRVEVHTPDVEQVRRLLDGVVEEYDDAAAPGPRAGSRGAQRAAGAGRDPGHEARRRAAHASRRSCSRRRRRAPTGSGRPDWAGQ